MAQLLGGRSGDKCVALNCANFGNLPCQFSDGGLGTCQAGGCYALSTDLNNCGVIGNTCPPLTECINGICEYGDGGIVGCEPPFTSDGSGHCVLQTCDGGPDNAACSPGGFCCDGVCVFGDARNCGGCGITCSEGSICWQGQFWRSPIGCAPPVTCPAPSTIDRDSTPICLRQDGDAGQCCGDTCVDLSSDPSNCAVCGMACTPGAACNDGQCSSACSGDNECPTGFACERFAPYEQPTCLARQCSAAVDGDFCWIDATRSFGTCCAGNCVSTDLACGYSNCQVCGPGETCEYGALCIPLPACQAGTESIGAQPQDCSTDAGTVGSCCGTACIDIGTDPLKLRRMRPRL